MKDAHILLVEDNPDDADLILRSLSKNVHTTVVVLRDGTEALDYLFCCGKYEDRKNSVQPRVVLLDIKLPKLSGLEVLQRLRENPRTRFIPVVILTSSREEQDIVASYRYGANSFVRKPVNFEDFSATLGRISSYWLTLNESVSAQIG